MKENKILLMIPLILTILIQGVNFAGAALLTKNVKYYDQHVLSSNSSTTLLRQNIGTIIYVFIGAALTVIASLFLIFEVCCNCKNSPVVYSFGYTVVLLFQFGIGVVSGTFLQNNVDTYDNYKTLTTLYQYFSSTQPVVIYMNDFITAYKVTIAATVVTFVIGVLIMLISYLFRIKQQLSQSQNEIPKQMPGTSQNIINAHV